MNPSTVNQIAVASRTQRTLACEHAAEYHRIKRANSRRLRHMSLTASKTRSVLTPRSA
jgi:hypothetical protein